MTRGSEDAGFRMPEPVTDLSENERALIDFWRGEMGSRDPCPDLALVHALRRWKGAP
jgi:hypothetical protein